jgi:hypothetical protein
MAMTQVNLMLCLVKPTATRITRHLAINNKASLRVVCISNSTQINGTAVGFTKRSAINLSTIADASNPTGGFVINGEAAYDFSGWSVSSAGWLYQTQHKIYLQIICHLDQQEKNPQSNHPSHRR